MKRSLTIFFLLVVPSALLTQVVQIQASKLQPTSVTKSLNIKKNGLSRLKENHGGVVDRKIIGHDDNVSTISINIRKKSEHEKLLSNSTQRGKLIVSASKITLSSLFGLIIIKNIYENRSNFPSKEEIQNYAFDFATKIKGKGDIGIIYFIFTLACFEIFGISTCPVEISGGFVYGIQKGFIINLLGKLSGAFTAFLVGRHFLSSGIRSKVLTNENTTTNARKGKNETATKKSTEIINLVQSCISEEPFTTALVLRYSMFPQLIKNLILSVLEPIDWKLFLLVTSLQVTPFTLLFTCLGFDSAQRILSPDLQTNYILSACFIVSSIYGIFGGTTVTALWYHNKTKKLRSEQ